MKKQKMCKAVITIGFTEYACHCVKGHSGPHVSRLMINDQVMGGFPWTDKQAKAAEKLQDVLKNLDNVARQQAGADRYAFDSVCKERDYAEDQLRQINEILHGPVKAEEIPF